MCVKFVVVVFVFRCEMLSLNNSLLGVSALSSGFMHHAKYNVASILLENLSMSKRTVSVIERELRHFFLKQLLLMDVMAREHYLRMFWELIEVFQYFVGYIALGIVTQFLFIHTNCYF